MIAAIISNLIGLVGDILFPCTICKFRNAISRDKHLTRGQFFTRRQTLSEQYDMVSQIL
jgi:hypothetical protein